MTMKVNPLTQTDFYKVGHFMQYPENTEMVFSNWTPRKSRIESIKEVVFFGLQYYMKKHLIDEWGEFFKSKGMLRAYQRRLKNAGFDLPSTHFEELYNLGYLPIKILALPEGSSTPIGVPPFVMYNTHPKFAWLVGFLETSLSNSIWSACTSATIAKDYRRILEAAATVSGGDVGFVDFQAHDFSCRGMKGGEDAAVSGMAHLLSFAGTDTIAAIDHAEYYYGADSDKDLIGTSVPATEHSVMCMGGKDTELDTYSRLMDTYPSGILSIVSDTWDYWNVLTSILPTLKNKIMSRDGKVVIRPDTGDPQKIICGDPDAPVGSPAHKGSFQLLWELFGGTTNEKGFKELDPHIGLIYGDSITLDRAMDISFDLILKGFVPNLVFGVGSYTYQMVTRDTFGFAMKATAGVIDGQVVEIFKDPITDKDAMKKSAKGFLAVYKVDGKYQLVQQVTLEETNNCEYRLVFEDGMMNNKQTFSEIRERIRS